MALDKQDLKLIKELLDNQSDELRSEMNQKFKMVVSEIGNEIEERMSKLIITTSTHSSRIQLLETDVKLMKKLLIK